MLVTTPSKKAEPTPNRRKNGSKKNGKRGDKGSNGSSKKSRKNNNKIFNTSPWKIIIGILIAGCLGFLYLKHVFATQELLAEVKRLEQKYEQVKRRHDYYQLKYDRMTGPKAIYDKAKAAGFIDGGPAEGVIEVKPIE